MADITVRGERAHTARSWMGINAAHRAATVLRRLDEHVAERVVIDGLEYREGLSAVAVRAGVAGNVVPDSCVITVDLRFAPALETALLDAELRAYGMPLAVFLGAVHDRVPAGVSVGIKDSVPELLDDVERYLAEGYLRIKLKIEPGWDLEPVRAVRERFGDALPLQVDANTAYTLADASHLRALDDFGLLLIEEPLEENNLYAHAQLQKRLATPVCLDESLHTARDTASAIAMDACRVVNIKPARVGGYLEARRIHDVAAAHGVPAWCGGMLETGIGRAPNLALAALPGCTLPGDTSASSRYFAEDLTEPFVLQDGHLRLPTGPGIGIEPLPDALARFTTARRDLGPTAPTCAIPPRRR